MCSLILINRHGQRAPAKNIYSCILVEGWTLPWSALIFPTDNKYQNRTYPLINDKTNKTESDQTSFPFGNLTFKGAEYMKTVGIRLSQHFPYLLHDNTDFNVLATNYNRTQVRNQKN